jgi:hypothetical protein
MLCLMMVSPNYQWRETMNAIDREKVIERVRKLLALSASPNENEAASAAAKAQAILTEYNLSMSEVESVQTDDEFGMIEVGETESRPWRRQLANATGALYFCKYFYTFRFIKVNTKYGTIRHDVHTFVGAPHNVEVAKMMFQYLMSAVDRLARDGSLAYPAKERTSYQTSFRNMCAGRLVSRIFQRIADAKAGKVVSETTGKALMCLDMYEQAKVKAEAVIAATGKALTTKKRPIKTDHAAGVRDGYRAGGEIGLDGQLTSNTTRQIAS